MLAKYAFQSQTDSHEQYDHLTWLTGNEMSEARELVRQRRWKVHLSHSNFLSFCRSWSSLFPRQWQAWWSLIWDHEGDNRRMIIVRLRNTNQEDGLVETSDETSAIHCCERRLPFCRKTADDSLTRVTVPIYINGVCYVLTERQIIGKVRHKNDRS